MKAYYEIGLVIMSIGIITLIIGLVIALKNPYPMMI
jgi:hypothetical protein